MNEEQKTAGKPGKQAGSLHQYTQIGNIKTPSGPDAQTSKRLDAQESKSQRDKQTVYLEQDLNDWVRVRAKQESRRLKKRVEISDIVNEALRKMKTELEA